MTLTTTFVNKTSLAFKLKEGNAGVYKVICTLEGLADVNAEPTAANMKTLEFDARSTYKEYRVVTARSIRIHISSDFILDHSTIYIDTDPNNAQNYIIRGDLRVDAPRMPGLFGPGVSRMFQKLFKRN